MEYNKAEYEQHSFENNRKLVVMCKVCNKPMEMEESAHKLSTGYPLIMYRCKECGTGMIPSGQGYHGNADDIKRKKKLQIKDL